MEIFMELLCLFSWPNVKGQPAKSGAADRKENNKGRAEEPSTHDEIGLGCSDLLCPSDSTGSDDQSNPIKLGVIPFEFSAEEKEEVKEYIRSLGPQYQNTTIVLDSHDVPDGMEDQIFFVDRDKPSVQEESRRLLDGARQHKAENPNPSDHTSQ